ncbi:Beta-lactamase enzyme family protein [Amycolatopsis pretoriensis]|uniref:Beta-lactamase enzyme family protein n=1 Tax=Amycolatopsis pretoriensis TaxID=218821 RepID=A0A1H5R060_9PSEU|nr:serine hydrolase [Amycolatopsis pretoriensis]SEF30817.1 Beta-lactamase enzyme family protein [Amycolatopsis pretoriensis]
MRKLSGIFLVGLCVGAIGAVAITIGHGPAQPPKAIAVTEALTTMSESASATPEPTPTPSTTPKETPKETPKDEPPSKVDAAELDRLVGSGEVSAVVFDRQRGAAIVSVHADRAYTSASLVKLLIALAVLDRGGPVADVQRMLSRSDDDLASRFWSAYGGPAIVTGWAKKIGLTGTRAPADPGRWGDTRITAKDVVKIYQYVLAHAPGSIMAALRAATERGSDGFRQYFGIPDAAHGRPWAVKQGWSCCMPTRMLHTSGVVGDDSRYIVVVLSEHPASTDYATASKRVTAVVSALLG